MKDLLSHEGLLTIYSIFLYFMAYWGYVKKTQPNKKFKDWWKKIRLDVAIAFAIGFGVIVIDDETLELFKTIWIIDVDKYPKAIYMISAPMVNIIYNGIGLIHSYKNHKNVRTRKQL